MALRGSQEAKIMRIWIFGAILGVLQGCALLTEGKFYDEQCTIPIAPFTQDVTEVCLEHDLDYRDKRVSRWEADRKLFVGLLETPAAPLAPVAWIIVRLAGLPWWGSDTIFDPPIDRDRGVPDH